jgi:transposase-like protein
VLQTALEVEMAQHLGYAKGDVVGRLASGSSNVRNGSTPKTVRTEIGEVTIEVPRDRLGTFEPQIVPKHQRRLAGFDEAVISLYAKGMTTGDIVAHLEEVYDTDMSRDLVSAVTDQVLVDMREWQSRPLDPVYPVILIDAIMLKVRANASSAAGAATVGNRPVYVAMGINIDGEREILGMWVGPTGGEGAKQWMNMLTELRNRGILDACIVCCDGLRGLPDAILATWPQASVQTCGAHGPQHAALCLEEVLADHHPAAAGHLHRPDSRGRRARVRGVRRGMGAALSRDDRDVASLVGGVHALPLLPGRGPQDHLHHG